MPNPVNVPADPVYQPPHAAPTNATSSSVAAALLSASPCRLLRLTVTNGNAAGRYIQVFDRASAPPASGETPKCTAYVPAGQSYTFTVKELGAVGLTLQKGCVVATSTTAHQYTAGSADMTVTEGYVG